MKILFATLCILSVLLLTSCRDESKEIRMIDHATSLYELHPDSTILVLDSILLPEEMSAPLLARWTLLYGRAADRVEEEMPYTYQLRKTLSYFQRKGQSSEVAEIGLYLGRSYVKDREYEKATQAYMDALNIALEIEDYNRAGYICSYMGDLYEKDRNYQEAIRKREESIDYFQQAGNSKSHAFALVNMSFDYLLQDLNEQALFYLQRADTIATSLNDAEVMAYVYNGLGNAFNILKNYNKAEFYLLKSIELDSTDVAPNYLTLANIYRDKKDLEHAYYYLKKSAIPSLNQYTSTGIDYASYLLEKEQKHFEKALKYYERYAAVEDSLNKIIESMNILEVEKRYNHLKLQNENIQLKVDKQQNQLFLFVTLTVCSLLIVFYLLMNKRKNRAIYQQRLAINEQDKNIYQLTTALFQKKEELQLQRNRINEMKEKIHLQGALEEEQTKYEKLKVEVESLNNYLVQSKEERLIQSVVCKKLYKDSLNYKSGSTKPLVTEKQWATIESMVKEIYPSTMEGLQCAALSTSELHLCYLILFKLDTFSLAVLLNIVPDSVSKQRYRVRQKLHLAGKDEDLYIQLINI